MSQQIPPAVLLQYLVKKHGLTSGEIVKDSGLPKWSFLQVLSGERAITEKTACKLATVLPLPAEAWLKPGLEEAEVVELVRYIENFVKRKEELEDTLGMIEESFRESSKYISNILVAKFTPGNLSWVLNILDEAMGLSREAEQIPDDMWPVSPIRNAKSPAKRVVVQCYESLAKCRERLLSLSVPIQWRYDRERNMVLIGKEPVGGMFWTGVYIAKSGHKESCWWQCYVPIPGGEDCSSMKALGLETRAEQPTRKAHVARPVMGEDDRGLMRAFHFGFEWFVNNILIAHLRAEPVPEFLMGVEHVPVAAPNNVCGEIDIAELIDENET